MMGRPEAAQRTCSVGTLFLGTAAWRPFDTTRILAGVREGRRDGFWWRLHWNGARTASINANGRRQRRAARSLLNTTRVKRAEHSARYGNGVKLARPRRRLATAGFLLPGPLRRQRRYLGRGGRQRWYAAPVPPERWLAKKVEVVPNYPATAHPRTSRLREDPRQRRWNAPPVACNTHIACHAVNIAVRLEPASWRTIQRKTSSSVMTRPTASAARRLRERRKFEKAGLGEDTKCTKKLN